MKVAIDKKCIDKIKDFSKFEYIYIFDDEESLEDLVKLKIPSINIKYIENIEVNLTEFNINCLKKCNIDDEDWKEPIEKKDYRFAIIVPNYNNDHGNYKGKTYLQNCIESVLNQTYKNFELIIVDDMSTDTSNKTIEKYKDNRIHLVKNRRKRYNGGSRNVGIEYALDNLDFDYFCFIDSDDWWKDEQVLQEINDKLYNHEMLVISSEALFPNGVVQKQYSEIDNYEDIFFCINKVWCTAWSKVIRKDKIVYFCEDTLMEDRVWTYKQADNIDFNKIYNFKRICYVWNRLNTENSVSMTRSPIWDASAWCHIGHQLQFLENIKHKEMKPKLEERIEECIDKARRGNYQQY